MSAGNPPDFPWKREEFWMKTEAYLRPEVQATLDRDGAEHLCDEFMERLRYAFDLWWDDLPESNLHPQMLSFTWDGKGDLRDALHAFFAEYAREFKENLEKWWKDYRMASLQRMMTKEMARFRAELEARGEKGAPE